MIKLKRLRSRAPLLVVIFIAFFIGLVNTKFGTYYSGWDNIHAEFNLGRYFNQVFFGSWLEHQALGAPAGQANLAEIFRLPFLLIFKIFLPDSLVRYAYIFLMYLIGGVGVYFYLLKVWLGKKTGSFKPWLASLGAVFYLLHLLTLQQFYISFELFMVQFAFLPFLLLSIHLLFKQKTAKNILIFFLIQFLIAPSGHTPTVFYLGVLFSLIYAFFLASKKGFFKAVIFSLLIGFLSFISNAYWIIPNLYYSFNHSEYVQESRSNALFATESLWSIREAGNLGNLLSGTHYLFNWRDYFFGENKFEFIFNEWLPHLNHPFIVMLMIGLGMATFFGVISLCFDKHKGAKRWAILLFFVFSASLIWIDILPTKPIIEWLYGFGPFLEAFRNPFTKISILYSFVLMLFFVSFCEWIIKRLLPIRYHLLNGKIVSIIILAISFLSIIVIAWPSFQGHFISEKLRVKYPPQYWNLFEYMNNRNKDLRVLQLPQYSHAGWVYHDWGFIQRGNGYQGMDFTFFGLPQAMMNRDSDRWVETSDFFYHQLRHALDKQDPEQFLQILDKYNIDLVIIDETKISSTGYREYQRDHEMVKLAGLTLIWKQDFLSVYERFPERDNGRIITPESIALINATENGRVRDDYLFRDNGDYLLVDSQKATTIYPFSDLMTLQLSQVNIADGVTSIVRPIEKGSYKLFLSGLKQVYYQTPVMISFNGQEVVATFPKNSVRAGETIMPFPQINDFSFQLEGQDNLDGIILFFNDQGLVIDRGETIHPLLTVEIGQPIEISYSAKLQEVKLTQDGMLDSAGLFLQEALVIQPDWQNFERDAEIEIAQDVKELEFRTEFPVLDLDLMQKESENCEFPPRGEIYTGKSNGSVIYKADKYAVNCNAYTFDFVSSSYPAILRITGEGFKGRGTKLFVSYTAKGVLVEEYMMPESKFDVLLSLHPVTNDPRSQFVLNWETRSFGKESINQLNGMQLVPLPLNYLAQITLKKNNNTNNTPNINNIVINLARSPFDFLHLVKYQCESENCFIGLDQSFDNMWIGYVLEQKNFPSHIKMNNWMNLWQVSGEGHLLIVYLPELVSLTCFFSLIGGVFVLLITWAKEKKEF